MSDVGRTLALNNGRNMPIIGLGTYLSPRDKVQVAVRAALDAGYRHIDTAYNYKNEGAIGEVLQEYINSGKVKREDLFIVTKLPMIHMDPTLVKRSIEMSLKKLQLSYIDLYLIHGPIQLVYDGDDENVFPLNEKGFWKAADKFDLLETWKAMEELVDLDLTKSIGVSNFSISQIERICKVAKHKPVTNQVECHIYLQQKDLFESCRKLDITITAYAPIGSPGSAGAQVKGKDNHLALEDPLVQKLSEKYGKTPAQILLRFLIQRGIIVIPKSVTPERIHSNIQVFDFSFSKEDMEDFSKISVNRRYFDMAFMFKGHPECPY